MRRALISDIHGNLVALQAVLKDCAACGFDEIACLGDMVGFGPDSVECIDLVMGCCCWALCGNHDVMLLRNDASAMNAALRRGMERDVRNLTPYWYSGRRVRRRWQWLQTLAPSRRDPGVLYVHASPRDPIYECVMPEDFMDGLRTPMTEGIFAQFEKLCFCGHTHRPGVVAGDFQWIKPTDYRLDAGVKTLVNVGSVGQPRDGNPASCYAIWDETKQTISFRRVAYDLRAAKERFARIPGWEERHYLRLERGL